MSREFLFFVITAITLSVSHSQENCGIQKPLSSISAGVKTTVRGEHPWKAAIFNDDGQFLCGGSLISNKAVVTAAQCIKQKGESQTLKADDLTVVLGAQDLSKAFERGRVNTGVKSIHVHPDWNSDSDLYEGDVALLTLEAEVEFSPTIQPICLSKPQSTSIQKTEGIVVGYQKIEGSNNAMKIPVSIKSYHNCLKDDNLKSYLNARTVCGSSDSESSDFEASSGSGLYVLHDNRFYLRGVTSASGLNKKIDSVSEYGIFSHIVEYCGWIQSGGTNKYAQCTENDFSTTVKPTTTTPLITTTQSTTTRATTQRHTTRRRTYPSYPEYQTNPTTQAPTTQKPIKSVLHGGECLNADEFIQSPNKCFKVIYQGDGNFVNYRASSMQHTWHSQTHGTCIKHACMQGDGNFVVYDCSTVARWHSHTHGHPGARIVIQDDGNLVVYAPNNVALWNSGTVTHC